MDNILNNIRVNNKYGDKKAYIMGSYVYNKIIKGNNDYEDVDILVNDVNIFYDNMKKVLDNCIILNAGVGEYGYFSWIKAKCDGLEKPINILDNIDHVDLLNKRSTKLYDFQRILYDGENYVTLDNNLNLEQTMEDYKMGKYCHEPTNLRPKDINRFNLQRKNVILCWKDSMNKQNEHKV